VANDCAGYGSGLRNDEELGHVDDAGKEAGLEMMSADVCSTIRAYRTGIKSPRNYG
jgi:hypothetical protein